MPKPSEEQKRALSKGTFNRTLKKKSVKKPSAAELERDQAAIADETQARLKREFYERQPTRG